MPEVIAVLIPIFIVGFIVTMIIFLRRFENQEKMALIAKGIDPGPYFKKKESSNGLLRGGLLLMGGGLGLIWGYLLDLYTGIGEVAYFSMLFLMGGIGLALAYFFEEQKRKNEKLDS